MYVTAEAVKLGDGYEALELLRGCEGELELGTTIEGIGAFAGLNFYELQTFGFNEMRKGLPLGLDPKP